MKKFIIMIMLVFNLLFLRSQAFGLTAVERNKIVGQMRNLAAEQQKELDAANGENAKLATSLAQAQGMIDATKAELDQVNAQIKKLSDWATAQSNRADIAEANNAKLQIEVHHLWKWKIAGCILAGAVAALLVLRFIMPALSVPNFWIGLLIPAATGAGVFFLALLL
ncbi:MAG: hypothetical protein ABI443_02450 [Chthoniobacterales bacterium]